MNIQQAQILLGIMSTMFVIFFLMIIFLPIRKVIVFGNPLWVIGKRVYERPNGFFGRFKLVLEFDDDENVPTNTKDLEDYLETCLWYDYQDNKE